MKLIDKDAVVAEIERRKEFYETIEKLHPVYESNIKDCDDVLSFINTLEVKEEKDFGKQGEQEEPQVYETEDGEVITYSESEGYKYGCEDTKKKGE